MREEKNKQLTLRDLQRWMATAILNPDRLGTDAGLKPPLPNVVDLPDETTAAIRMRIHIDGYPARVRDALLESYPAVEHIVGDEAFTALTYRYLEAVPRSYNLNRAGEMLPDFLLSDSLTEKLPFLPGLARLESCVVEAFHAELERPANLDPCLKWSAEDWHTAVLHFQSSVYLVRSSWPIMQLREARNTPVEEIAIELEGRPDRVLVYRSGFDVKCESIGEQEAQAIGKLMAGETLGHTFGALADQGCQSDSVMKWFSRWTTLGLITGIRSYTAASR